MSKRPINKNHCTCVFESLNDVFKMHHFISNCVDIDHINALCLLCFVLYLGHKEVPKVHFKSNQIKSNLILQKNR